MTRRLYYEDLYRKEFDAALIRQETNENGARVVLDFTLFYPGGGGQPCDLGTLGGRNVLDVFEEGGEVIHVVDGPVPEDAALLHGAIDWDRRFELMQQHLGQHILAAVLYNRFGLHTARMRIEGEDVSMDFDGVHVGEDALRSAEAEANDVVCRNIPVEILYPDFAEIENRARKRPPETSEPVRIVKVGDVDYVPCCGLHVRNTGEVGVIKATALESHKGGTRVHLRCGRAACRWLDVVCHNARQIQLELTCPPEEMYARVLHLKDEIRELKSQNESILNREAEALAERLVEKAERVGDRSLVVHVMDGAGQDGVRRLFRALTERPGVVALIGGVGDDEASLSFGCRRDDRGVDVRGAFGRAIEIIGGRGGGAPFQAQGQSPIKSGGRDAKSAELRAAMDTAAGVMRAALA